MNDRPTLLIAEIVAPQGIRGQVRVNVHSGNPEELADYRNIIDQKGNPVSLKVNSFKGKQAIATVKGTADRNGAEKLVGTKLYITREALPEAGQGQYYFSDLEELEVRAGAEKIGVIKQMHNFGAGDIMEIALTGGKSEMLPFNKQVVLEVNVAGGYILIDMPDTILITGE